MSQPPPANAPAGTPELLRDWPLPVPDDDGSKHDRGTILVAGGADSTHGALMPRTGRIGFLAREGLDEVPQVLTSLSG